MLEKMIYDGETPVWYNGYFHNNEKENVPFQATLKLKYFVRSVSSTKMVLADENDSKYEVFVTDAKRHYR